MRGSRAVQVVLGEGEPGILRFILEAEGFHVVGQARGESELRKVLDATHPSVVVLDAGISAAAAMDARTRATGAQLVVVWPNGVRASVAEERVDPATAFHDLGGAVRRAAERATGWGEDQVVTLPESPAVVTLDAEERPLTLVPGVEDAAPPRARRRARQLLMVAAAWTLALTASAAIGLAVPRTFELFEPDVTPRPSIARSPDGTLQDRSDGGGTASDAQDPDPCARPDGAGAGASQTEPGRPDDPGRGCGEGGDQGGQGKGRPDAPRGEGNGKGRGEGGGQPDTPGEPGGKGGNGNGGSGDDGAGGKSGKSGDEEAASDDDAGADVGATGNGGNGNGKSSGRGAASGDSSGSNDRGNGPG